MNQENRKKSEAWVKEKANEFTQLDCDLTFAEWCYQQGRSDAFTQIIMYLNEASLAQNDKCYDCTQKLIEIIEWMEGEQNEEQ